ncbi:hypothetical protein DFJ73DRAFT_893330 [Zopfochytrium polystomum]|nr:hypothetical protein DFJ73DRAFT_893330 [Zopfochytrium polystomum]
MRAAEVQRWGQPPSVVLIPDLDGTAPDGDVDIAVEAVAVHQLVRARASGRHYSTAGDLPHRVGTDGVGTLLAPGSAAADPPTRVYFVSLSGSFSDRVRLPLAATAPLPPGADPHRAAALTNPAMSAWMALKRRVRLPPAGWTLLILGATTSSGRIAARIARSLGAARVVGAARRPDALAAVASLDSHVVLGSSSDPAATDFAEALPVAPDVVLDYLAGAPAAAFFSYLAAAKPDRPVQFVQIGQMAGPTVAVPAGVLRSCRLSVVGSGFGSWAMEELYDELPALVSAVAELPKEEFPVRIEPLEKIESVWAAPAAPEERLVFTL